MQIYLTKDGKQNGPYSVDDLNAMLESEAIMGEDLCWYEGCEGWIPLSKCPAFAVRRTSAQPPPPPSVKAAPTTLPNAVSDIFSNLPPAVSDFISDARRHPLGVAMLAVAALGAILVWRAEPGNGTGIAIATILITAILGGVEAKQLGIGSVADTTAKSKRKSGPWNWGALILLLWIAGFPAYLYRRSQYGARNLLLPAAVVSVLFVAAAFLAAPALPAVDAPEVLATAQRAIEESPAHKLTGQIIGPISISDAGEVSYDPKKQKRVARAIMKSKLGSERIYYSVEWLNRSKGTIWVQIQAHE